jgi:hypothetical protein
MHPLLKEEFLKRLADSTIAGKRKLMDAGDTRHPDVLFHIAFDAALAQHSDDITDSLKNRIESAVGLVLANRRKRKNTTTTRLLFQFRPTIDRVKKTIVLTEISELVDFHYRYDDQRLYFTHITGSTRVNDRFLWEANLFASSTYEKVLHEELIRVQRRGDNFVTIIIEGIHHVTFFIDGRKMRFSFYKPNKTQEHTISGSLFDQAWSLAEQHFGLGDAIGPLFKTD